MEVLHGEPGTAGISTGLPPGPFPYARHGDGLPRTGGPTERSTETVRRRSHGIPGPFGRPVGERPDPAAALWPDHPSASVPKTWPGGKGEAFEPARQEPPARLVGPVQFVLKLMEQWKLETGDTVGLLGFDRSDADYVTSVFEGHERLRGRDVKDRIFHLYEIRKSLRSLFQDLETENAWLREPHEALNGKSPMGLMLSGSMERLVVVRDYVDTFAGR